MINIEFIKRRKTTFAEATERAKGKMEEKDQDRKAKVKRQKTGRVNHLSRSYSYKRGGY